MLGDWDCAVASGFSDTGRTSHNHITLRPSGDAFEIASTLDGSDKTVSDVFGYDAPHRQWYERSLAAGSASQDVGGDLDALTPSSLVLRGILRFGDRALQIRSTYSWSDTNAYRFEGAALTSSGDWQTLEVHDCKRKAAAS